MRLFDICELLARDFRDPTGISEGLAVAGVAASVVGAGVGAVGAISQANASSASASYNAEVAANNQVAANQSAQAALQEGQVAQQQKAYQEDVLVGQEKAGLAANGVDVGSGSAVDILSDTKAAGELDQLTILNNAARTSVGFTNQGINYGNQANINEAASQAALTGGDLAATSDVIKGAGAVASTWYNYTNNNSTGGSGP